ncbi:hypothetical protein COCNU_01G017960 [Cocos nucifera]|uniref:CobW/HypB/UreG nucleotide-binding domain-containing protein n=1 Tax=Cocos nucifera TaxID=13894 RepID=A0A8K0HWF7_COCNU|nr:hypothetical protein COCNU_01G017960 [Cocos nucifera]
MSAVSARSYTIVAKRTAGIGSGRLAVSRRSGACARRFVASATATEEGSDVLTKIPPDERIPATIITGFLGSGKTTLLNHILTAEHGKRIAVIENEFGEVDIDGSLVAAKTTGAEDIVMLNNGCLCCTVRGDLVRMISELVDRKKGKFDHIVIETTGLANPAPIIQTFYAEDKIFNDVKLDGVVTLVDAKHAGFHLDEEKPKGVVNEAVEQIAYADRIIVNKTDLVGESDISSLIQRIKNINRMAHLKRAEYGRVDLDYVLGIGGFDLESFMELLIDNPYLSIVLPPSTMKLQPECLPRLFKVSVSKDNGRKMGTSNAKLLAPLLKHIKNSFARMKSIMLIPILTIIAMTRVFLPWGQSQACQRFKLAQNWPERVIKQLMEVTSVGLELLLNLIPGFGFGSKPWLCFSDILGEPCLSGLGPLKLARFETWSSLSWFKLNLAGFGLVKTKEQPVHRYPELG